MSGLVSQTSPTWLKSTEFNSVSYLQRPVFRIPLRKTRTSGTWCLKNCPASHRWNTARIFFNASLNRWVSDAELLQYFDSIRFLVREQLEALEKMATCQIMHLSVSFSWNCLMTRWMFRDAHWGNVLYSRERGIRLIDFGIATLVNRFELPDYRAALIVTFTLDRCLDCEGSKLGRSFQELVTTSSYPIQGQALLSHPWLEY